jgi:hypothetical protein
LVADVLAGAWRRSPSVLKISCGELAEVTPLVLKSGAGALGWWRVRNSDLQATAAAMQLQEAHRFYAINAAFYERDIEHVFSVLKSAGIEAILIKGWAAAQLYPEPGLRPSGDIDLVISSEQYEKAERLLRSHEGYHIDLKHREITEYDDRSFDELFARSRLLRLGKVEVRVLGAEDHLRVLCIHMLKHGAWRPLWLCDIAAALESLPTDFDWDLCLSNNPRRANWVKVAIGLAYKLLGVQVDDPTILHAADNLPNWLLPATLRQWSWRLVPDKGQLCMPALLSSLRNPSKLLEEIRVRWDRPIAATMMLHRPFNGLPRTPLLIIASIWDIPDLTRQLLSLAKRRP